MHTARDSKVDLRYMRRLYVDEHETRGKVDWRICTCDYCFGMDR
jgi:hypothetical protein